MARSSREFKFHVVQIVKDIQQKEGEVLRIAFIDFGAGQRLDIRRWFQPSQEMIHTRNQEGRPFELDAGGYAMGKGISIHPDDFDEFFSTMRTLGDEWEAGVIEL